MTVRSQKTVTKQPGQPPTCVCQMRCEPDAARSRFCHTEGALLGYRRLYQYYSSYSCEKFRWRCGKLQFHGNCQGDAYSGSDYPLIYVDQQSAHDVPIRSKRRNTHKLHLIPCPGNPWCTVGNPRKNFDYSIAAKCSSQHVLLSHRGISHSLQPLRLHGGR